MKFLKAIRNYFYYRQIIKDVDTTPLESFSVVKKDKIGRFHIIYTPSDESVDVYGAEMVEYEIREKVMEILKGEECDTCFMYKTHMDLS